MSDRTSARIFGMFFEFLAKLDDKAEAQRMAREVWLLTHGYDFSPYQMNADDALRTLGLLRDGSPDEYGEPTVEYGPEQETSLGSER